MKSVIIHADGRRIDLAAAVDPETYAELENGRYSRTSPSLWCGSCGGSIYIRHGSTRTRELFGAHHQATDCSAVLTIRSSAMTEEHKHQAEYHAGAAERTGHTADLEVTTTGRTRVDVVIDDRIGIEIQRSELKKAAAVDRGARSAAAGLTSVTWFTDRDSRPQWFGHVPGYRSALSMDRWQQMPPLGTAAAAGLRIIEAVRCGTRAPCPHQRGGSCGRFVEASGPWRGLYIDDVVEGLATGYIHPVRLGEYVQLLSVASIDLYEELTGIRLDYDPGQPRVALQRSDEEECARPLCVPSDAPAPVREWFEAELARIQQERAEREHAEHEAQLRREQAEREQQEQLQRELEARARAVREQQAQLERDREARERAEREAEVRREEADREARLRWEQAVRERQERDREARERAEREAQLRREQAVRQRQERERLERELRTVEGFLRHSAPCARPGCHSGFRRQPGRTMDASGLCYACRTTSGQAITRGSQ